MHRFVEPPPTPHGRVLVPFYIADWEIECCAPPPAVGHEVSWRVSFEPGWTGPDGLLAGTHRVRRGSGDDRVVVDDAVVAHWTPDRHGPPPPEPVPSRGTLVGTVHGGLVPDDLAPLTGRVERVRLLRSRVVLIAEGARRGGRLETVPGTARLVDVQAAPRWFAHTGSLAFGDTADDEHGVLVDVTVRSVSGSDT